MTERRQTREEAEARVCAPSPLGHTPNDVADNLRRFARAYLAQMDEIERLREFAAEGAAVCSCGCPPEDHENYGEDGEGCTNPDHVCMRTSRGVLSELTAHRARIAKLEKVAEALAHFHDRIHEEGDDMCAACCASDALAACEESREGDDSADAGCSDVQEALEVLEAAQAAVDSKRGCERDWERLEAAVHMFLQQWRRSGGGGGRPDLFELSLTELEAAYAACQPKEKRS